MASRVQPPVRLDFMRVGVELDYVRTTCRADDSSGNIITPLNVHLAMTVAFGRMYRPVCDVGTVVALMLVGRPSRQ